MSVNVQSCWGCELVTEGTRCDEFMTEGVVQEGYKQRCWRKFVPKLLHVVVEDDIENR
jgi:hypothetical protein